MIDLHTHSTFSDGALTPTELVELASKVPLTAIALTDHDCTGGVAEFMAACRDKGVTGISGVEISANVAKGAMHMLGYYVTPGHPQLEPVLDEIRDGRHARNLRILERLNDLGLSLTYEEVASYAGEDVVARPHFARAMVDKGYVKDKQQAFDRYLAKGQSGYVDRFRLSPEESIKVILNSGGVPVLAHPASLDLGRKQLAEYLAELKDAGLAGIECYYSAHSPARQAEYLQLADQVGLVATGGSDFHGDAKPKIYLGVGFGGMKIPDTLLVSLEAARMAEGQ